MPDESSWLTVKARLQGARQFAADAALDARALKGVGDAAEVAGRKSAFAAEKTFLLGEEMYSLKRYSFWAITSLGLTAGAVVKMGYSFNEAKDKGTVAFTSLLGSASRARKEMNALVNVADQTGISLENLTSAARTMTTFGFTVKQTNAYLKDFANYAQFKDLGSGGVNSLVSVFNQIKNTGKLDARGFRQLQALGVPESALTKGLGLSQGQAFLLQHGQAYIPASVAVPQLASWLNRYAGGQPKSVGVQFDILRQNLSTLMGGIEEPLNAWLGRNVPRWTGALQRGSAGFQRGGVAGGLNAIDRTGTAANVWKTLTGTVSILTQTLRALWDIARPFVFVLGLAVRAVSIVTSNLTALKLILDPLIGLYLADRAQTLYRIGKERILGVEQTTTSGSLVALRDAAIGAADALTLIKGGGAAGAAGSAAAAGAEGGLLGSLAAKGGAAGLLARGGTIASRLGKGLLLFTAFNDFTTKNPNSRRDSSVLSGHAWAKAFGGSVGGFFGGKWIGQDIGAALHPGRKIPGQANGGRTTIGGLSLVGERGTELLNLPQGAQVMPLGGGGLDGLTQSIVAALERARIVPAGVYLGPDKVGEAVFKWKSDQAALA